MGAEKTMVRTEDPAQHPLCDQGFIAHPISHPLVLKKRPVNPDPLQIDHVTGQVGISFVSGQHVAAGTKVVIEIPISLEIHQFDGTVTFVREIDLGFEIGVWLDHAEDMERIYVVEETCHLEQEREELTNVTILEPVEPRRFPHYAQRALHLVSNAVHHALPGQTAGSRS